MTSDTFSKKNTSTSRFDASKDFVGATEMFEVYDTHGILQHHDAVTGSELQPVANGTRET